MDILIMLALGVLAAAGIAVGAWSTLRAKGEGKLKQQARVEGEAIIRQAEEESRKAKLAAQEEVLKVRANAEAEVKEHRQELNHLERRYQQREENLERKAETLERQQRALQEKEGTVQQVREELDALKGKQLKALEEVAGLPLAAAREMVLKRGEEEAKHELAQRWYLLENEFKAKAEEKGREILITVINRLATDVVPEATTSSVPLPNDEMKGRLIGREGRNIRALEALTGVDVLIDDTPEMVTVSCFDPVRREVARLALEKLIADGRIQPTRIEEMVQRAQAEVEQTIWKAGEQATFDTGVSGVEPELVNLLGQLKFRYSYGENVLQHSIEVSLLAGMLAAEVGADVQVAKVGGLLHDIGKALTHAVPGPHAEIGAELGKRHGANYGTYRAILEHHSDEHETVEAFLVATADAISASRPGARRESLENYVKRLRDLEQVATSFPGVERAFAIQAGREVRVMVKPADLDDVAASALARDIARKVESDLVFPGQIKVTVIRETRSVDYAR